MQNTAIRRSIYSLRLDSCYPSCPAFGMTQEPRGRRPPTVTSVWSLKWGSVGPWRNRESEPRCRPPNGREVSSGGDTPRCERSDPGRKPGSGSVPRLHWDAGNYRQSRWTETGRWFPYRFDELWWQKDTEEELGQAWSFRLNTGWTSSGPLATIMGFKKKMNRLELFQDVFYKRQLVSMLCRKYSSSSGNFARTIKPQALHSFPLLSKAKAVQSFDIKEKGNPLKS